MLAGMGYEIETQWRRDNDAVTARNSEQYRAAMDSQAVRRVARQAVSRPSMLDRMVRALRSWAGNRPAAQVGNANGACRPDPAH
jgi:hypothetical protein